VLTIEHTSDSEQAPWWWKCHFMKKHLLSNENTKPSPIPNIIDQLIFINTSTYCWVGTMMEVSFYEKTPSFRLKYQTSPIPNINDQLILWVSSIWLISFIQLLSFPTVVFLESRIIYNHNLWPWHRQTDRQTDRQTIFFSYDPPYSRGN
jgi:hypothetical protein